MLDAILKRKYQALLETADIKIDGDRPWDIRVRNEAVYKKVSLHGSAGLGEAYMDGWWECEQIEQMVMRIFQSDLYKKIQSFSYLYDSFITVLFNLQKIKRAFQVGEQHYDLSYQLFKNMLDKRMIYSCGYWKTANNLD